ncbi:MAG: hypothetical protein ACXAE3_01875 [Candidatus Kariarchaeaceae archaeon]|jgi:hypothetical protein
MINTSTYGIFNFSFETIKSKYGAEITIGLLIYLFVSYLKGFIYVGVSFLSNYISDIAVVMLGVIPILFLLIPNRVDFIWQKSFPLTTTLWVIATIIPALEIRVIFIVLGTGLLYGSLRYNFIRLNVENPQYALLTFIMIDLIFKSPSRGIDPLIVSSIFQTIFILLVVVPILYMDFTKIEIKEPMNPKTRFGRVSIMAFFGMVFVSILLFFNPGVASLLINTNSVFSQLYIFAFTGIFVVIIDLFYKPLTRFNLFLVPISILIVLFSMYTYPWDGWGWVWPVGLLFMMYLLTVLLDQILTITDEDSLSYSVLFTIGIVIILFLGLQLLTSDSQVFRWLLVGLFSFLSFLSTVGMITRGEHS